ncbi:hypothetical protein rpr22_0815 [Rickettsia prowazekii str. Rp22]|uniref:Uncharacterized protein n=1 Tax=Rickettsia prowazekii (strain Rp22) TaxID=449216 RepID=D5AY33_RICPP|nr:hypothetical protein rpr22_0815 [Rickettsia prowazekii str. Rp22]
MCLRVYNVSYIIKITVDQSLQSFNVDMCVACSSFYFNCIFSYMMFSYTI